MPNRNRSRRATYVRRPERGATTVLTVVLLASLALNAVALVGLVAWLFWGDH